MKTFKISPSSNPRILRSGKIVSPRKNAMIKKKAVLKMKIDNQFFFPKTSQKDLSTLHDKNKNGSHDIMVTTAYDHLFDNRGLYILLKELSWPVLNDIKVTLDDQNNNNCNKNCYKNLEDYIQLNELQIYNELEPKKERNTELITTKKAIQTAITPNIMSKKNKTKANSNSVTNQNIDVRITRGKTIKLQIEERKQLDQIMFSKFPNNTFKMFVIKLDDISEEAKFLSSLGLTCRFKCPLTTYKLRKKH